jgi:hypothetical protein
MAIFISIAFNDSEELSRFDAMKVALQVAQQITTQLSTDASADIGIDRINVLKRTACSADDQLVRFVTCIR